MKILIVSINEKIPALKYGGTERVIWDLGKELVKMGNKVTYLVKQGSFCDFAEVIFYDSTKHISKQVPKGTDVIHSHSVLNFSDIDIPNVFTLHGNTNSPNALKTINNPICISNNHAQRNNIKTFVYNGLDWNSYPTLALNLNRAYFHFLGKATWKVKNLTDAAKIAIKSKNDLWVLGGEKWRYDNLKKGAFWKLHPSIKYQGMVDNQTKMELLSKSKGLIFPVKWHEPFGLAVIESMYAGCPVFGSKYGSLPELITEQVGFTSDNIDELIEAVKHKKFKPEDCRIYAIEHFSSKLMAINYMKLYQRVLNGEKLD